MKQVLVVCTANICRSPAVAALIQLRLAAAGLADQVTTTTAGVFGVAGQPADVMMAVLLAERKINLNGHRSHPLNNADLTGAALVLVMEEAHRQAIFYRSPQALHKVLLLSELAGHHADLPDPHGGTPSGYRAVIAQVDSYLDAGWPRRSARLGLTPAT